MAQYNLGNIPNYDAALNDTTFTYKDHTIGGKLVTSSVTIDTATMAQLTDDAAIKDLFRKAIVENLVKHMIENKLIEVVQQFEPTYNMYKITARCFVTPNSDIKILRTHSI